MIKRDNNEALTLTDENLTSETLTDESLASKTLTRADLSKAVYREIGLSLAESSRLVDGFFNEIVKILSEDKSIKLTSFGSLKLRQKKSRMGRNPKTGIEAPISARKVVTFSASNKLKDKINNNNQTRKQLNNSDKKLEVIDTV